MSKKKISKKAKEQIAEITYNYTDGFYSVVDMVSPEDTVRLHSTNKPLLPLYLSLLKDDRIQLKEFHDMMINKKILLNDDHSHIIQQNNNIVSDVIVNNTNNNINHKNVRNNNENQIITRKRGRIPKRDVNTVYEDITPTVSPRKSRRVHTPQKKSGIIL